MREKAVWFMREHMQNLRKLLIQLRCLEIFQAEFIVFSGWIAKQYLYSYLLKTLKTIHCVELLNCRSS
jgi:hypothetical protein